MKKRFDPTKLIPPGYDWDRLKAGLGWGYTLSALGTLPILHRYFYDRLSLYGTLPDSTEKVLMPGTLVSAFGEYWQDGPMYCFLCFLVYLAAQVVRNYRSHYTGSMSIYTMRRLPDKWELHRRCWTVPVLAALGALAMMAVLAGVYYWMYLMLTPDGHLP